MSTSKELMEIQVALRNKTKLSDLQVAKVASLQHENNAQNRFVSVAKLALREGEELWDFYSAMATAVQVDRILLVDGSLDAWLHGIYEDYIIVQDWNTGRFFKAEYTRGADGSFSFSDPVEVVMTFIPAAGEMDEVDRAVSKRMPEIVERLNVGISNSKWSGVIPGRF